MQSVHINYINPSALKEDEAAKEWYGERSLVASRSFITELIHAVDQVEESPDMWPQYEAGTRRYVFPRFPFSLIYRNSENIIYHTNRKEHQGKQF